MGARFISEAQAAVMNAGMAANYGIAGQATLVRLGPNMVVDQQVLLVQLYFKVRTVMRAAQLDGKPTS